MTHHITTDRLQRALRGEEQELLDSSTLTAIRRSGSRRRSVRQAASGLVAVVGAGVLAAGLGIATGLGGDDPAPRVLDEQAAAERPEGLSDLQRRILREVPGARRISDWQVGLPEPGAGQQGASRVGDDFEIVGATIATGSTAYAGVTIYPRSAFPGWLHDEISRIEREELGDENSHPVGSTQMGVLVEAGAAELACVSFRGGTCRPAVLRRSGGDHYYEWSFGTDGFLQPGTGMEVFAPHAAEAGDAPRLTVAGLPGTDVVRVEFVTTTGRVVDGHVTHALAPGSTIMWADVPGALARVIAYDAGGGVVEDHELRECSGGVDCEVR